MGIFLTYYFEILFLTVAPILAFGTAIYFCNRAFCSLVGDGERARPLLLAAHILTTPLREFAHLAACMLFFHSVSDYRLLSLYDPDGELGFVEHSYNKKNPVALLGNFFFAVMPVIVGLFAVLVTVLVCFSGAFGTLVEETSLLEEAGGDVLSYFSLAFGFLPTLFAATGTGTVLKIVGCLLLLLLSIGVFVSLDDLQNAFSGAIVFGVAVFLFAGVTALFDDRLRRLILYGLRGFATSVTALLLVALVFSLAMVLVGFAYFLFRSFLAPASYAVVPYGQRERDEDDL